MKSGSVIPDQIGKPCPIKYVLYIIKENRTYDQVLGAFKDAKGRPAGNGDEGERDKADREHRQSGARVTLQVSAKVDNVVVGIDAGGVFLVGHGSQALVT